MRLREFNPEDRSRIEQLLGRIREFEPEDQALAMELVDYALAIPGQKDYEFILAEMDDLGLIGYACYGPTPLTDGTFDLYWIAVDPDFAGRGIGTAILKQVETEVVARNGRLMVIETSSSAHYDDTRQFYLKKGYHLAETIQDFFRKGEDRVTYIKKFRD